MITGKGRVHFLWQKNKWQLCRWSLCHTECLPGGNVSFLIWVPPMGSSTAWETKEGQEGRGLLGFSSWRWQAPSTGLCRGSVDPGRPGILISGHCDRYHKWAASEQQELLVTALSVCVCVQDQGGSRFHAWRGCMEWCPRATHPSGRSSLSSEAGAKLAGGCCMDPWSLV